MRGTGASTPRPIRRAWACASAPPASLPRALTRALTRALALDHVGDGIRVNCVAPGTIETPFFDPLFEAAEDPAALRRDLAARQAMNRLGRPEEIAGAMLYLACDESSFVTGTMLTVDGGMTAR